MTRVKAKCRQTLPPQHARRQAEAFAARMDEQFGLEWRWQGDTLRFAARSGRARGVRGDLTLAADEVQVTIELPFLLGVIGGTLRARADALLRETFDPAGPGQGSEAPGHAGSG